MNTVQMIRVLVVDDSPFMRAALKSGMGANEQIEVIGTAQNGQDGLKKIESLKPDVVTLDIEMPGMDGLEVLEIVMKERPLPIVVVSTKTQKGAETTLEALRLGAVDYVAKPLGDKSSTLESFRKDVVRAVLTAAVSRRPRLTLPTRPVISALGCPPGSVIAIGISAGGPATLHKLIPAFPASFPPIVLAQHMPSGFTAPFARRLNDEAQVTVCEAKDNMDLRPGHLMIAPGDRHLRIVKRGGTLKTVTDQGPKVSGFRPSVDVLFESVAAAAGRRGVGVVMTGMGCDGSDGVRHLKAAGAATLAQDQETSIVYGMPKAAFETGAVDRVIPLDAIPSAIAEALQFNAAAGAAR